MAEKKRKYLQFFLNLFLTILLLIVLFYFGGKILAFFMPFVIGWIIAMIANPLVQFLERKIKMVRKHSSMIIIIAVLAAIIGIGYLLVNKAVEETSSLIEQAPEIYQSMSGDFEKASDKLEVFYQKIPEGIRTDLESMKTSIGDTLSSWVQNLSQPTVDAAGRFVKYLPTLFVMIIFTILSAYFFVAERDAILKWFREHTPDMIQEKWQLIIQSFKTAFGGYFKAQLKIMVVVYAILLIGLLILRVHFAALVAFLIAFLDMLPFFGTGTALIPWAVFQFLAGDTRRAIALLVVYAVSQIVHQVIQPKLVGDSVGVNPLFALFLMFIGFRIHGVLGMIIAIPIGMIILNFYKSGVFDDLIGGAKMICSDIYHFIKQ